MKRLQIQNREKIESGKQNKTRTESMKAKFPVIKFIIKQFKVLVSSLRKTKTKTKMSNINNFVDRPMSGGSSSRVNNININNNRRRSVVPELAELAEQEAAKLANMRNNRSGSGNNINKNIDDDDDDTHDGINDDDDELKHNLGSSKDIGDGVGGGIRRISKYQITSSRHRPVFGPAWQIAPGEEHLYNRQFLNMMYLNKDDRHQD